MGVQNLVLLGTVKTRTEQYNVYDPYMVLQTVRVREQ